jgi:hypothetical protein
VSVAASAAARAASSCRPLLWVVDPKLRRAEVFTDAEAEPVIILEDGSLDGGVVLPGFTLPLRDVFDQLDQPI